MLGMALYRPDIAETNPGVSGNVRNVLMQKDANGLAYGPHPSLAVPSAAVALPALPRGGLWVVTPGGAHKVFYGTAATIQELGADFAWTEVHSGYAVPTGANWGRCQFNAVALWSNLTDGLLAYDIVTPGIAAVSGAPKFKHLFKLFDCVCGLQSDGDGRTFHTSAPTSYTEFVKDGARYQTLTDGEDLTGGAELSQGYGVLFQRRAWHLMTRVTDRRIWQRTKMDDVGCTSPESIVAVHGTAYFVSDTGFVAASPAGLVPIGKEKVNRTFINDLVGDLSLVEGAYDPVHDRIIWRYPSKVGSSTIFPTLMCYDLAQQEFVPIDEDTTSILTAGTPGYTVETAAALGTVDTVPYGPDSRFWLGGNPRLFGLDENMKAGWFEGAALAPSVDTAAQYDTKSVRVTGAEPATDAASATVRLGYKQRIADSFAWGEAVTMDEDGFCPVDEAGKVMAARVEVPAGAQWGFIRGVNLTDANVRGGR